MALLKVKKLHPEAKLPVLGRDSDAGIDIFALEDYTINPGETVKVKTGVALQLDEHMWKFGVFIKPRSGMGSKGIDVYGGVCDKSYTGEYMVLLNYSQPPKTLWEQVKSLFGLSTAEPYKVFKGDKIAQLCVVPIVPVSQIVEVEELEETDRGEKGFGSSGR